MVWLVILILVWVLVRLGMLLNVVEMLLYRCCMFVDEGLRKLVLLMWVLK